MCVCVCVSVYTLPVCDNTTHALLKKYLKCISVKGCNLAAQIECLEMYFIFTETLSSTTYLRT